MVSAHVRPDWRTSLKRAVGVNTSNERRWRSRVNLRLKPDLEHRFEGWNETRANGEGLDRQVTLGCRAHTRGHFACEKRPPFVLLRIKFRLAIELAQGRRWRAFGASI